MSDEILDAEGLRGNWTSSWNGNPQRVVKSCKPHLKLRVVRGWESLSGEIVCACSVPALCLWMPPEWTEAGRPSVGSLPLHFYLTKPVETAIH